MSSPKEIVQKWHDALNSEDVEGMVALVHHDVKIGGPRGSTSGTEIMREWFGRAHVRLYPLVYYQRQQTIVVEEQGEWRDATTGEITGSQKVATIFMVEDELITSIVRLDQIENALSEAGLTTADRA